MSVILKYPIPIADFVALKIPGFKSNLAFQMQGKAATLWVEAYPEAEPKEVIYRLFGTGQEIRDELQVIYVGTAQDSKGFVWHLYQDIGKR